jgi:hypothetical protein
VTAGHGPGFKFTRCFTARTPPIFYHTRKRLKTAWNNNNQKNPESLRPPSLMSFFVEIEKFVVDKFLPPFCKELLQFFA